MYKNKLSFFTIIIISIIFIITTVMSINIYFLYNGLKNDMSNKMKEVIDIEAEVLRTNIAEYIDAYSVNEYEKLIKNSVHNKEFLAIIIKDYNMGSILSEDYFLTGLIKINGQIENFDINNNQHQNVLNNSYYNKNYNIILKHKTIGTISIYVSGKSINDRLDNLFMGILIKSIFISITLIVILLFTVIYFSFLKPIKDITESITDTDNYGIPKNLLKIQGNKEITTLIKSINNTISLIKDSNLKLQKNMKQTRLNRLKYKTLLDLASDEIFILNSAGELLEYSYSVQNILGYDENEMHTLSVYDWDKDITKEQYEGLISRLSEEPIIFDRVHTKKDGSVYYAQISARKIFINNQLLVYASVRDNSKEYHLKEDILKHKQELEKQNKLLEEKNIALENSEKEIMSVNKNLNQTVQEQIEELRKKEQLIIQQSKLATMGEMIGNIAHQWRQPLNVLSLHKDIIIDDYFSNELNDDKIEKFEEKTNNIIQYLSKTIDDFRNFFVPSTEKTNFELIEAINNIVNIVDIQLKSHDIKLNINNKTNQRIFILGYPNEFKQVLINLINNSKDAIMKLQKSGKIKNGIIDIDIDYNTISKETNIYVSDNGGGIPEDIIHKIFEPYFTTKFKSQGTGLGLYMSKTIVEINMNGKLDCENIENGAKFTIKLND
jgi:PAS domain S-box-containing protein